MKEIETLSAAAVEVHAVRENGVRPKTNQRNNHMKPEQLAKNRLYCGRKHEANKLKCSAYGETCHKCKKDHFKSMCGRHTQKVQNSGRTSKLHKVSDSDSYGYYDTIQSGT